MTWDELKQSLNRGGEDASIHFESDGIPFSLTYNDDEGEVLFSAELAPVSEDISKETVLRGMLEANHLFAGTGGASLSIDPETLQATLRQTVWIDLLDFEPFMIRLEAFVSMATEWNQKVAESIMPTPERLPWLGTEGIIMA